MIKVKEIVWCSYDKESFETLINKFLNTLKEEQYIGINFLSQHVCWVTFKTKWGKLWTNTDITEQ